MVPHLTTALNGPLLALEKSMLGHMPDIEHWFRTQWLEYSSPFYASVDLRNSGFKLAPVDTNLFPGGFNNLNPAFLPWGVQAAMTAVEKICPEARRCTGSSSTLWPSCVSIGVGAVMSGEMLPIRTSSPA